MDLYLVIIIKYSMAPHFIFLEMNHLTPTPKCILRVRLKINAKKLLALFFFLIHLEALKLFAIRFVNSSHVKDMLFQFKILLC